MKREEVVKSGQAVAPSRSPASAKKPSPPPIKSFIDWVEDDNAPLAKVIDDSRYQEEIAQWTENNSSDLRKLMRRSEVVQWLYQNNRIDNKKWDFLINAIMGGHLGDLLKLKTKFSIILWSKLCKHLVENPTELKKCSDKIQILLGFLSHASLEQRLKCFAVAEPAMMGALFELCSSVGPLTHCLYSVLCQGFDRIRNEEFFIKLLSFPFFFEFALAASSQEVLGAFEEKYQGKKWLEQYKKSKLAYSRCRAELNAEDKIFSETDKVVILRYLRSIINDKEESKMISYDLVSSYFRMNDPDICVALFANPILCERLIELHRDQKIVINCQDHIFPLMQWMMEKETELSGTPVLKHLLKLDALKHYFIGAVELLFAHYYQDEQDKLFLEQFFEYFGTYFFTGVTIEQLKGLQSIRGNDEVILGRFAAVCAEKVEVYTVLGNVKEEDILSRWKATSGDTARFIEEFQYKGSNDVDRWMKLLSCEWKGDLNEKDIIDRIVKHCKQLRFADFLKEIKGTPRIDQLFSCAINVDGKAQLYLARRILGVPNIFGRCAFTLDDFKSWQPVLLLGPLSQAAWHKNYGFRPMDFYQLIREDQGRALFSVDDQNEGFLDRLLTHSNLNKEDNRRARLFLVNIFSHAPADVQEVVQAWLRRRVRKILLKAVEEQARTLGIEQHRLTGMMQNQAALTPRHNALVTLNHYLTTPLIYLSDDFLEILNKDSKCKQWVTEILSKAPGCVQDLIGNGRSAIVAEDVSKPWCAQGKPYKKFIFGGRFEPFKLELQAKRHELNGKPDTAKRQAFVNLVWRKNCEFILALLNDDDFKLTLLQSSKTIEKGAEYLKQLLDIKNIHEVSGVLNTNPLARRAGLMMHPHWLEEALFHLGEDQLQRHTEVVGTYLQLPEFLPTTRNLHPVHLKDNEVNADLMRLVKERPRPLVEYLIDLCHFDYNKKLNCTERDRLDIRLRATMLVELGIEFEFKRLLRELADQAEDKKRAWLDRFLCLCVSASEFLLLKQWDGIFERNEAFLSYLCPLIVEYDLVTMSASEAPAFVRLQMIVLRNLSKQLVLPAKSSEAQIQAKQAALNSINQILWQLSCVPGAVLGKIRIQDCLDEASLQSMDELDVRTRLAHLLTDAVQPAGGLQTPPRSGSPNF